MQEQQTKYHLANDLVALTLTRGGGHRIEVPVGHSFVQSGDMFTLVT